VGAFYYVIETQPLRTDIKARAPEVHSSPNRNAEFEAITVPNLTALHRKARRMLKDTSAAEDMVQETCLRAWQIFDQFTPGTNGRAWLFAILMNIVRHECRRRGRWRIDPKSQEILENRAAPIRANTDVLNDRHLLSVIEAMPSHFRKVLLLAAVSGLQYHEIAEALQIPIGTVMSRLSRARAFLRSAFIGSCGMHTTAAATANCICRISSAKVCRGQHSPAWICSDSDVSEHSDETLVA